jgi:hypothetical protein
MSKRVRLGLLLGLMLLGLVVVTIWYGQRKETGTAASGSQSGAENGLSVHRDTTPEHPADLDHAGALPPPQPGGAGEVGAAESAQNEAKNERAAAPAKARTAPASVSKRKAKAAEEATAEQAAPAPAESAPPPVQNTPPPPPPPVQNGILIGRHHNAVGATLRLVKITYMLDGQVVATEEGGKLEQVRDFEAFNRRTSPGEHTVTAIADFQGNGRGVFSYFDSYRYRVRSDHRVTVRETGTTTVTVSLYEKSGPLVAIENRLAIGFRTN